MKELSQIISGTRSTFTQLEQLRQLYLKRRRIYLIVLLVPLVGLIVVSLAAGMDSAFIISAGIWLILGLIIYYFRAGSLATKYKSDYKTAVIPKLLHGIDPQLSFEPDRGIPLDSFVGSELFTKRPDRYNSEDLVFGNYGKTFLQLAEVHAEDRQTTTDSKGRSQTRYVTIFKGLILIADFHKDFAGRTFVLPDTAEKLFGRFGRHLQKLSGRRETDLIHMEDPEFEKTFAIYSTDEIECRYILSTAMMRRLLDMQERFGSDVRVGFKESNIVLAVPRTGPFLEPSTGCPATDASQVESLLGQLRYFLDTVEELNLNTRIWSKK